MTRKMIIILLLVLLIPTSVFANPTYVSGGTGNRSFLTGNLGSFLGEDWVNINQGELEALVYCIENGIPLGDNQITWVEEVLFYRLSNMDTRINMERRYGNRDVPYEQLLEENLEEISETDLGAIQYEDNFISHINFLVTSTKRSSEARWDVGNNLYFDVGDQTIVIRSGDRITYGWWHQLWEETMPGVTVPNMYTIDMTTLKYALSVETGISLKHAEQILQFPYAREHPPRIEMRSDINVFNAHDSPGNTPTYSFNTKDRATAQSIYDHSGVWFVNHTISDIQSRFQTIEISIPPLHVNIHHLAVEEGPGGGHINPAAGYADEYKTVETIETESVTLSDYEQFVATAIDTPEGYKFVGSAAPGLMDVEYGPVNYIRDAIGPDYKALPRISTSYMTYEFVPVSTRTVDILGDTDIYFYYEKDALPDFQSVSIDPGTEYSMPGESYDATATFRLKEEGYFWPHEGDIKITHNDTTVLEEKNVVFQLGETKSYDFTWTGTEDDSRICIEIWPSIPTVSQPKPGERLEDAYPDDNKLCIDVENGEVTLTVLTDPNIASVGTTNPEPGIYKVERDSVIDLSATPNNNWEFVRWKGDISSTNPDTSVTMDESKVVIAEFARKQFKLTIEARPPEGGTTNPGVGTHYVDAGSTVTIRAYPGNGYEFISWGGDGTGTSPTTSVYMNSNKHVIAYFQMEDDPPQPDPKGLGNPILVE